ncbi:MAG: hypothetical protein WC911_03685 [Thermoleophilia bacterium]
MDIYIPKMREDERTIQSICFEDASNFSVDDCTGTTRIAYYEEPGEMAVVGYFAVYKGDFLSHRVPARMVVVQYRGLRAKRSLKADGGQA